MITGAFIAVGFRAQTSFHRNKNTPKINENPTPEIQPNPQMLFWPLYTPLINYGNNNEPPISATASQSLNCQNVDRAVVNRPMNQSKDLIREIHLDIIPVLNTSLLL